MLSLLEASVEGARDWPRLQREYPTLGGLEGAVNGARSELEATHQEYVTTVSSWEWTVSLETASVLMACCRLLRPSQMLDTGSGYSSYILRRYAAEAQQQARVTSVDLDPLWLDKTRSYLSIQGLPVNDTMDWSEFQAQGRCQYDLVLHDLGSEEDRIRTLDYVLGSVRAGGIVLLDDAHMTTYGPYARRRLTAGPFRSYSLRRLTRELRYSRYAMLGVRA